MVLVLKKGMNEKQMDEIHSKIRSHTGVNTKKYCGVIKLQRDSLSIQKQMRGEWQK